MQKCQVCDGDARFDLTLNENIHCYKCNTIKYDTTEKLVLCNLQCPNLYWMLDDYQYDKHTNTIQVIYGMEKDECIKCGVRDIHEGTFVGQVIGTETCECCEQNARYKLELVDSICCPDCNEIKHEKNLKLVICSTQCKNLQWKPVEYLTKKRDKDIELIYQIKDDECSSCGSTNDSKGKFVGKKLLQLESKRRY